MSTITPFKDGRSKYAEGRLLYDKGIRTKLSSECIPVQINGLRECKTCLLKNDKRYDRSTHKWVTFCGGSNIRLKGKNKRGYVVPLKEKFYSKQFLLDSVGVIKTNEGNENDFSKWELKK